MTDESNCKLIDLVQAKPCIYDKTDVFYSNKDHVKSVWNEIANDMQQTVPVCQKRWRYLRDYFVRQLHMTQVDQKRSYWSLYYRMLFLKPFSTTRKIRLLNESCAVETTTTTTTSNLKQRKRKRKRLKKSNNEQNSNDFYDHNLMTQPQLTTQILSVSSGGNSNDEFNSFDYLNLYQAHFGSADDEALQQRIQQQIQKDQQQQQLNEKQQLELQNEIKDRNSLGIVNGDVEEILNNNNNSNNNNNNNSNTNNESFGATSDTNFISNLPILLEKSVHNNNNMNSPSSSTSCSLNEPNKYEINSMFDEDIQLVHPIIRKKYKKSDTLNEILSIIKNESNQTDEHEHFFKSLLTNVRKIDEDLIMPFRSEILQIIMKYRYMSQQNLDSASNSTNQNNLDYDGQNSELIVIDTGETDWRNKLKNRF